MPTNDFERGQLVLLTRAWTRQDSDEDEQRVGQGLRWVPDWMERHIGTVGRVVGHSEVTGRASVQFGRSTDHYYLRCVLEPISEGPVSEEEWRNYRGE